MFEINYSQLIQYDILEKLVTFIMPQMHFNKDRNVHFLKDQIFQDFHFQVYNHNYTTELK